MAWLQTLPERHNLSDSGVIGLFLSRNWKARCFRRIWFTRGPIGSGFLVQLVDLVSFRLKCLALRDAATRVALRRVICPIQHILQLLALDRSLLPHRNLWLRLDIGYLYEVSLL